MGNDIGIEKNLRFGKFGIESNDATEAYKNKDNDEIGDIERELGADYVLFVNRDGKKSQVAKSSLEEIPEEEEKEEVVHIVETDSFKRDYANLPNKEEAAWFRSNDVASSINILRYMGFDAAFKVGRVERETISNNNTTKGNATVYALIKGKGSHNQFRPYFYRGDHEATFVRCVIKKTDENGPNEYKAIQDTIDYKLASEQSANKSKKSIDKRKR